MDEAMGVLKPQQLRAGAVATPAAAPPPRQRVGEAKSVPITVSVDESDSGEEDESEKIAAPRQPQNGTLRDGEASRESLEAASVHALVASGEDSADEGVPPPAQAAPPRDRASPRQPQKNPRKKQRQSPTPKQKQQKPKKKVSARRKSRPRSISPRDYRADEAFVRQKNARLQAEIQMARSKLCALSYGSSGAHPAVLFNRISSRPSGQATSINLQEFRNALRKDGGITRNAMSDADIEVVFKAVDQDENGAVDIDELAEFVWPGEAEKKQQALRGAERLGISRAAAPPTKRYEMDARVEKFMANFGDLSTIHSINPDRSLYGGVRSVRSASPSKSVPRVAHPTMYTGATRQAHAEQARARTPGRNGRSPERVARRKASTGKQRTRSAGPRSRSRRSGRKENGPNTSGGISSKDASPGRRARSAPKSASIRRSPTRPSRSDHSRSPMGTLKSQGSPPPELFLKRAEAARASTRDSVNASADAIAAWGSHDSAAAGTAATVQPVRRRVPRESLSPNSSNRPGVSRSSSPMHTWLHQDAQHRVERERELMAQQAEHHKKENFISRDRMLDFISRQAASEESRQEKLQLARAAGLESETRGEPIDCVTGPAGSPNRGFREQWVADQAERYIKRQQMLESKAADYHAAQLHAMTRDSIILQRRAESKEQGPRGSVSPSRSEPADQSQLAARLSTRSDMSPKTAELKKKLEETREAELTFSPQLNPKSVKLASKRDSMMESLSTRSDMPPKTAELKKRLEETREAELTFSPQRNPKSVKLASKRDSMMELAGVDSPVSETSPRKHQRDIHTGPAGMSPLALSPMDTPIESLPAPDPEQTDTFTDGEEGHAPDSPRTVRSTAVRRHFGVELTAANSGDRESNSVEDAAGHAGCSDSGGSGEGSPRRQGGSPRGSLFHRASGSPRRRAAKMEEVKKEQAAIQRAREAEKKLQTSATTCVGHDDLSSVSATLDAALTGSLDLSTSGIPTDHSRAMGELLNLQADHTNDHADKLFPDGVPPMVSPTTQVSAVAAHGRAYEAIATAENPAEIQLAPQEQAGVSHAKHEDAAVEAEGSWMSSLQMDPVDEMDELESVGQEESDGSKPAGATMQQNDTTQQVKDSAIAATVINAGSTTEIEPDAETFAADANRSGEHEATSAAHKETVEEEAPDDILAGMAAELGFDAGALDSTSTEADDGEPAGATMQQNDTMQQVKDSAIAAGSTTEIEPDAETFAADANRSGEHEATSAAHKETVEEEAPDDILAGMAAELGFDAGALDSTSTEADDGEPAGATMQQNDTMQQVKDSAIAAGSTTEIEPDAETFAADANRSGEHEATPAAHKETVEEEAPDDILAGMAAELGFDAGALEIEADDGEPAGATMQQNDTTQQVKDSAIAAGSTTEIEPDAETFAADANRSGEHEATSAAHKETVEEEAPDDIPAGMAAELGFDAGALDSTDGETEGDAAAPEQQPVKTEEADMAAAEAEAGAHEETAEEELPDNIIDRLAAEPAFDHIALDSTETDGGEADWETQQRNKTRDEETESATAAASATETEPETGNHTDPAVEQDAPIANNPHLEEDLLGDDDPFAGLFNDDFLTAASDVANSNSADDADAATDGDDDLYAALEAMLDD